MAARIDKGLDLVKPEQEAIRGYVEVIQEIAATLDPAEGWSASRESDFALAYVLGHADTPQREQAAIDALLFKCDILWAMLDALQHAYGEPRNVPPGAFLAERPQ